jgi:adenylosuccinate synthase
LEVDVVVDLQFGSTAKGKLCQHLAIKRKYDFSVRVQSIQAGHTVIYRGKSFKMRTIPCAWVNPDVKLVLGAGCFIEKPLLLEEIDMLEKFGISIKDRLFIDYRATYVISDDKRREMDYKLTQKMGSTSEGAGSSLIRKLWRRGRPTQVKNDSWALDHKLNVCDTLELMEDSTVLLEGCQGTLLGVHTTPYYPFCTSRECSASAILGEAGISPRDVRDIFGVFRTMPIRVGGNSGPTGGRQLTWKEVSDYSGNPFIKPEVTTVTNRERRIFCLSIEDLLCSLRINNPSYLVCTFLDYINFKDRDNTIWDKLSDKSKKWVNMLECQINRRIDLISTGQNSQAWITAGKAI